MDACVDFRSLIVLRVFLKKLSVTTVTGWLISVRSISYTSEFSQWKIVQFKKLKIIKSNLVWFTSATFAMEHGEELFPIWQPVCLAACPMLFLSYVYRGARIGLFYVISRTVNQLLQRLAWTKPQFLNACVYYFIFAYNRYLTCMCI